ncbi:unnamed protein product [Cylindrotheca closterium]|uniref:Protein kinase domain-containing protein n=1 Tax=Cylindrotheca closterium TaxID=2856 RepID=A0AAD2CT21_9STRA|nr:unnamed protein product [Cylindrotheca closterium]
MSEAKHDIATIKANIHEDENQNNARIRMSIGRFLGSGAFGSVYKISKTTVGQEGPECFLKIPNSHGALPSLKEEAKTLRRLNKQKEEWLTVPNIPLCSAGQEFDIAMNGFQSKTYGLILNEMIGKPANAFNWKSEGYKECLPSVIRNVHATLDAAHKNSVYHLDVRPSNIIVPTTADKMTKDIKVLVIDWGVAIYRGMS